VLKSGQPPIIAQQSIWGLAFMARVTSALASWGLSL